MIGKTLGHYQITDKLGEGGMGEVFLANDLSLGRKVALKFLSPGMLQDPLAHKRLVREAKAAAALDHPNICNVHEVAEAEGQDFIVMEYVEGQTLRERLLTGPLAMDEALGVALEVTEALEEAHEKGIIHRDLKPANIMLTRKGHAKVMDFGLAKHVVPEGGMASREQTATSMTAEGSAAGTLAYMSPEQLRARSVDARSDLFSFGIVLYEMLAGVHPFRKDTGVDTASAILNETPPALSSYSESLAGPVARAVDKLLAKRPEDRYQTAHGAHADLKQIQRGDETMAVAGVQPEKSKRPRRGYLALAGVALAVLAALLASWIQQRYFRSPASALAFRERDWILITDFENQTGEDVFSGSLETAMTVSIQQSKYVNVFPRNRVREALKRMRRENVQKLDENLGREVALREGIKGLLACSIGKVGTEYLLAVRLVDPGTQMTVYSQSSLVTGKDRILGALGELADRVRRDLGESLPGIAQQRVPLPQATTSSLEALKAYTDAYFAAGATREELLNHALELDPEFALAHADLGVSYYIDNRRVKGEEHFRNALDLFDRLTLRERLWIRALIEDWRGNRDQAIESYRAYLHQYPDDIRAWYRLGYGCLITDRLESSVEAFKKVLEINPAESGAYVNLASCYNAMRKNEEAVTAYEKAFQVDPTMITALFVNNEYGFLLVRMGNLKKAEEAFRQMLATGEQEKRAKGHRSLGLLNTYRGKFSAAVADFRESILINKAIGFGLGEMNDHILLASVYRMKGLNSACRSELAEVGKILKKTKVEPAFLYYLGRLYARTGSIAEASRVLDELQARLGDPVADSGVNRSDRTDRAFHALLRGEIELARKNYDLARELIATAGKLDEGMAREPLAYVFLQSRDRHGAIPKYEEFLRHGDVLGAHYQEYWILAHYELGKLYESEGDPRKAMTYYERFVSIWREGDEDLLPLKDARRRIDRLKHATAGD